MFKAAAASSAVCFSIWFCVVKESDRENTWLVLVPIDQFSRTLTKTHTQACRHTYTYTHTRHRLIYHCYNFISQMLLKPVLIMSIIVKVQNWKKKTRSLQNLQRHWQNTTCHQLTFRQIWKYNSDCTGYSSVSVTPVGLVWGFFVSDISVTHTDIGLMYYYMFYVCYVRNQQITQQRAER